MKIIVQEDGYVYPAIYSYVKILLDGIFWGTIHQDYWSEYLSGGTSSPYTVYSVWDIYQMENGDLLLGGAIANDTLLPNTFRGISRIHADGSHDPTFPVLNITPNTGYGAVHRIFRAPDGAWYISGGFTAINGHETNRLARLTPDFEVDTTFVSPFIYDGPFYPRANVVLVDNQNRVWVSGDIMRLQEDPNDTIQIIRLLPDGEVDSTFLPRKLENVYPDFWTDIPTIAFGAQELINEPGKYIIHGQFNYFNDTLQPCITAVNDAGVIQNNFFQDQGATVNLYDDNASPKMPRIDVVKQRPDGSIFIGGAFSQFMGEERYSVVKLKPDSITATQPELEKGTFNLYPNPASETLHISMQDGNAISGMIYNALGKNVFTFSIKTYETQIDIHKLEAGIYFVKIKLENGEIVVRKFVKGR